MSVLYKVQRHQLPLVKEWLKQYLPESWACYCLIKSTLEGRWTGHSFFTLGWPTIRGVTTGPLEPDHPCPDNDSTLGNGFLYAHQEEDVKTLLNHPAVIDWSKPFFKTGIPERIAASLREKARANGCLDRCFHAKEHAFYAKPGDIEQRPVPKGYRIRALKLDSEIDYCVSTWPFATPHTDQYLRALVRRLPSVCLTDDQDRCLSFEIGTEYGALGFLYTREEVRGRGLAKAVVSRMAEEYRKLNRDVLYLCIVMGNEAAFSFHQSMGFTYISDEFCYFHYLG